MKDRAGRIADVVDEGDVGPVGVHEQHLEIRGVSQAFDLDASLGRQVVGIVAQAGDEAFGRASAIPGKASVGVKATGGFSTP